MNYFKNTSNEIFGYDDEQVKQGYGKDLIPITEQEKDELLKPTPEQLLQQKIVEAKSYLQSTDYKMTIDYFATMTPEQQEEVTILRAEAREFVRANEQS